MRLVNSNYGLDIELLENQVTVLVVEKAEYFRDIVDCLYRQIDGEEGAFILSENEKNFVIEKSMSLLMDLFSIDFNDRKILNKIYAELTDVAAILFEEKEKINSKVICLLDQIIMQSQYDDLSYNLELDWTQLLKLYNIHIEVETTGFVQKLLEYEKILTNILHHRILCLVNFKTYLEDYELQEIYKTAAYHKLHLIMIESVEREALEGEKTVIIDKDRCVIVK